MRFLSGFRMVSMKFKLGHTGMSRDLTLTNPRLYISPFKKPDPEPETLPKPRLNFLIPKR